MICQQSVFEVSGKNPLSAFKLNVNQSSKKNILKKDIKLQSFKKIPPYKNPKILKIHMQRIINIWP